MRNVNPAELNTFWRGGPGSAMPGWRENISIGDIIAYERDELGNLDVQFAFSS